ncbi:DUF5691 domain-containing protein [Marichromatium sp. AB31]|uniref:DUF5691 domain-containing protein n=1 Tax=Marichromatium sp. AB31 TaxID=2483362 RepID=UPI000F3E6972|nr:DUF5691 domain-containing protein [Marichromatium sp. AB31]RNE89442.1 hypothetical protein EBL84_11575 [Marichromatium sp. AB31]
MIELWNDLTRTALLGTERGTRTWDAPNALGTLLSGLQAQETDAPVQLLRCSAVVGNFVQAGRLPARLASAAPSPAAPDPRPALGSARHLRLLLQDDRLKTLFPEWLTLLAEHGLRAPESSIPTLLGLASRSPDLRRAIIAVIGAKGLWLAGQSPEWAPLLSVADLGRLDAALWETGTPEQRLAYLVQTRREAPAQAVELLAAVWSQEGARERRKLLGVLSDASGPADVAFLESALADRSKDVRGDAAGLLARIPGSTVRTRAVELLDGWLGFESGTGLMGRLKGRKSELSVTLPEDWDSAWTTIGIHEKPPKGMGRKAWWLEQLLGLVDPDHWVERWQLSAPEILRMVEGHAWQGTLLAGWRRATRHFGNGAWARALIVGTVDADADAALWAILPPTEQENALTPSLAMPSTDEPFKRAFDRLGHLGHRWSPSFSSVVRQACLKLFREQTPDANYARYAILRQVAAHLDPGGCQAMEQGLGPYLQASSPWQRIATEMFDTLRFRNDMIQAIESARIESDQRGTP